MDLIDFMSAQNVNGPRRVYHGLRENQRVASAAFTWARGAIHYRPCNLEPIQ
jgi:hypothetical protein